MPWGTEIETGYLAMPQLYDVTVDAETRNVAADHPDVVAMLKSIVDDVRAMDYFNLELYNLSPDD